MKYETPEVTALGSALDAVHGTGSTGKSATEHLDGIYPEVPAAYADWE
jgi:hypothetical protein